MRNILVYAQNVLPGDNWTNPGEPTYVVYNNLEDTKHSRRLQILLIRDGQTTRSSDLIMSNEAPLVVDRPK